jgi:hypothetical protein
LRKAPKPLTHWLKGWIDGQEKFKEALIRKTLPRRLSKLRKAPKYMRPRAVEEAATLLNPAPVSVLPGYHKLQESVKRHCPTETFWGWGEAPRHVICPA